MKIDVNIKSSPLIILLICDATLESGSGHVMRQITLGVALKNLGLEPILFCYSIPDALVARAEEFQLTVQKRSQRCDSIKLSEEILSMNCDVAVFDGYEFLYDSISEIFDNYVKVVLIDDNGDLAKFPCHLVINQNLHADAAMYASNETSPQLLLGLSWAMIRPEVVEQINITKTVEKSGILLSIGGTDHLGITPALLDGINQVSKEKAIATGGVLTGGTLTPLDMAITMSLSKVGIIACGTTTWEAVCLSLPFVGLVTADNQVKVGDSLVEYGIAQIVDCRYGLDIEMILQRTRQLMTQNSNIAERSIPLIDGGGALRSAERIFRLFAE
jgi:spore coat polysaccharide biosynthesis predicted glycosyltransferase SpsG